jgi:uncharacterized phage protein (TIGR02218 family)
MKTLDADMQTHLEQPTTTLTWCIRVERLDGVVLAATAFDQPLTFGGDTYEPFGFLRRDIDGSSDLDVNSTEVTGILSSDALTEDDVRIGRWDFAAYSLVRVNWADLTIDPEILSTGNLGVVRTGRLRFVAELLGLVQAAQNSIGVLNSAQCIHNFGKSEGGFGRGNGCTFDLATVTDSGTVESVDSDLYGIHDSARTEADTYYSNGVFRIMDGDYAGMEFEIRAYIVGFWILFTALPEDITGAAYEIVRGCDKSLRQCVDDFDNIADRLASDYTQGADAAIQVARHDE